MSVSSTSSSHSSEGHGLGLTRQHTKQNIRQQPKAKLFDDVFLNTIHNKMQADPERSSLLSNHIKTAAGDAIDERCKFTVQSLLKASNTKTKASTPRAQLLGEQMRRIEDKYKFDAVLLEEMQEFVKARAKLELDYAAGMQRLSQQFHNKRKWPAFTYTKGHDNILLVDLWRSVINLGMEDAKNHAITSDQLTVLTGEIFEKAKEEKRTSFKLAYQVLTNLQEELLKLDGSVAETKSKYDASRKSYIKKRDAKKAKVNPADLKKAESSWQFCRQEYLLECAAANQHYLRFRNEQLPEVMDAAAQQSLRFTSNFLKAFAGSLTNSTVCDGKNMKKVDRLSNRLAAEFERRTFLHEHRHEFPGRQMFELECTDDNQSQQLAVDTESKHTLMKIRELLKHTVQTLEAKIDQKEAQMTSLKGLRDNYTSAGSLVDQSQSKVLYKKMQALHTEIEAEAVQIAHLTAKIARITEAGVDETDESGEIKAPKKAETIDLDAAQAREMMSRNDISALSNGSTGSTGRENEHSRDSVYEVPTAVKDRALTNINSDLKQRGRKLSEAKPLKKAKAKPPTKPRAKKPSHAAPPPPLPAVPPPPNRAKKTNAAQIENLYENGSAVVGITEVVDDLPGPADLPPPIFDEQDMDTLPPPEQEMLPPPMFSPLPQDTSDLFDDVPPPPPCMTPDIGEVSRSELANLDDMMPPTTDTEAQRTTPYEITESASSSPDPDNVDTYDFNGKAGLENHEPMIYDNLGPIYQNASSKPVSEDELVTPEVYIPTPEPYNPGNESIYEELRDVDTPQFHRALYDYRAIQTDDLSISSGEQCYVLVTREDGWCQGLNERGQIGYFPSSYIEKMADQDTATLPKPRIVRLKPTPKESLDVLQSAGRPPTINHIEPGTVASTAGLFVGDMILEVDDEPCASAGYGQIASWLSQCETGRTLKICVVAPLKTALPTRGSDISVV